MTHEVRTNEAWNGDPEGPTAAYSKKEPINEITFDVPNPDCNTPWPSGTMSGVAKLTDS